MPPTPLGSTPSSGVRSSSSTRPTWTQPASHSSPSAPALPLSAWSSWSRIAEASKIVWWAKRKRAHLQNAQNDRWARRRRAFAHPTESRHRPPADDRKAQLARNPVDRGDRDQDHQDQERHLLPFQHADLLGQLQADAARADDTDDRRRAGILLDKVEHLARDDRQHLRHQAKADLVHRPATQGPAAFDLLRGALLH